MKTEHEGIKNDNRQIKDKQVEIEAKQEKLENVNELLKINVKENELKLNKLEATVITNTNTITDVVNDKDLQIDAAGKQGSNY